MTTRRRAAATALATSLLAAGCVPAQAPRPTVIAAAAPVTLAVSASRTVAPLQRLEVSREAWAAVREVAPMDVTEVDGRAMVVLGRADEGSGVGKIRVVDGGDRAIALRAPSEGVLADADQVGAPVTLLDVDGGCDAVIADVHVGAFIEFEQAAGQHHTGADIWDAAAQHGGLYLLGELAGGPCVPTAAKAGATAVPAGTVELGVATASDVVRDAALAAMAELPAFAELQHGYLTYQAEVGDVDPAAGPGRWTDSADVSVQVLRAGRDVLAIANAEAYGDCGGFGGQLFTVWRVTGAPAAPQLEPLYQGASGGAVTRALVTPDGLGFQFTSTPRVNFDPAYDTDYDDEGCGC